MRRLPALVCIWLLALCGCSTPPAAAPPLPPLLHDTLFGPPSMRIDAAEVFAMSDAMQQYLNHEMAREVRAKGWQQGLVDALYAQGRLKLVYDASMTRTAAQAFEARAGNCLSLVLMTAAFARALDIPVQFHAVAGEETWTRDGGILFTSGHVNLTLGRRAADGMRSYDPRVPITIDFLPPEDLRGLRSYPVSEATIVAMYMNNRAAESLAQARLDDAYGWTRAALAQAPGFAAAYNTLGVVYLRRGQPAFAEEALRAALAQAPEQREALSNLGEALKQQGRMAEAAAVAQRLARLEPHPPFEFFDLGRAAMARGDYAAARELFGREIARADDHPSFHFWLAMAHYQLGDMGDAHRELERARDSSGATAERALYAAKLERLQAASARTGQSGHGQRE